MKFIEVKELFKGKKVLITGNTGFKGSWLSLFMHFMCAEVYGLANNEFVLESDRLPITSGSYVHQHVADIRDRNMVFEHIRTIQPDFIFHLAANAITLASYEDPLETFQTNAMGTANVLDAVRVLNRKCHVIIVSSDKCYENKNWVWGYRESDNLAGMDPYSASKSIAELITKSYYHSFFAHHSNVKVASCRAGNVIGGGDWSKDRIVPDCIKLWRNKKPLLIRNPNHIRPWNYVLDVLWGYILTAYHLETSDINGEAFNFGPNFNQGINVSDLVDILWSYWPDRSFTPYIISELKQNNNKEHEILKLNSDKAFAYIQWSPKLTIQQSLSETISWYINVMENVEQIDSFSQSYIEKFTLSLQ